VVPADFNRKQAQLAFSAESHGLPGGFGQPVSTGL